MPTEKYFISVQNAPLATTLSSNIATWELNGLDGLAYKVGCDDVDRPLGSGLTSANEVRNMLIGTQAIDYSNLYSHIYGIAAMKAALKKSTYWKKNFLRVDLRPGTVDWFSDWRVPLHNAEVIGVAAKESGGVGVWLDNEPYTYDIYQAGSSSIITTAGVFPYLFRYDKLPLKNSKTAAQYGAQIRFRASQFMERLQQGFGGNLILFTSFGYYQAAATFTDAATYGLFYYWLDGLWEAKRDDTVIIDGYEDGYSHQTVNQFTSDRAIVLNKHKGGGTWRTPRVAPTVEISAGLWLDYDSNGSHAWSYASPNTNYNTPALWEDALVNAATYCADRFVWIYTQQPNYYNTGAANLGVPVEYATAANNARTRLHAT